MISNNSLLIQRLTAFKQTSKKQISILATSTAAVSIFVSFSLPKHTQLPNFIYFYVYLFYFALPKFMILTHFSGLTLIRSLFVKLFLFGDIFLLQ